MVAGTLLFASCSNDENTPLPDGTSGEVPALVLDEFNSLFPGATNVVWSTKGEYAVASFYWDGSRADNVVRNHTAWFALANGVWGMTEKEIRFADLPEAVKNAFGASEYGQAPWRADDEVDVLKRNGDSEILYVIDVEKNEGGKETDVDLYYTAEGVLVKEVIDAEDEKDYQDYLPQTPSGTVESWLKEKYPDARIIDVDNEDGGTEVEFISGNMKHEAFFDRSQNWVYTKTEYRFRNIDEVTDIPSEVLAALKATPEYLEAGWVEDAEKYETEKAGTFYCFELENRFDDDVKVYIGSDGTVLQGRPGFGGESSGGVAVATDIIGRSGFKLKRKFIESGFLEADILYHFPSSLIRREFIQPFLLSIEYSYPRRPIYLMPAKCKEICIQVLHVHFHVRYALRTVYQDRDTVTVSRCNHLLHRIHSTEHIANMHQTHQFCTFRKKFLIRIDKQFAFIIHRDNLQHNTSFLSL